MRFWFLGLWRRVVRYCVCTNAAEKSVAPLTVWSGVLSCNSRQQVPSKRRNLNRKVRGLPFQKPATLLVSFPVFFIALISSRATFVCVCVCVALYPDVWNFQYSLNVFITSSGTAGTVLQMGARGGAVGWGTALQAGRSRVPFPMVSLAFSINIILPVALWPWCRLSL